ncbi:hypothetical protein [Pontibacter virosus]|uniref:Uncharacterized protein n=1 Tax=Pontibacter virosus TaxID=1765052 RepID=A0A2U1B3H6_9BACT|nr:hypothetical protein [Pontibacter virosus]PVY43152.1 hypothetical protein C8E01_102329 [Pontibacter virosus]
MFDKKKKNMKRRETLLEQLDREILEGYKRMKEAPKQLTIFEETQKLINEGFIVLNNDSTLSNESKKLMAYVSMLLSYAVANLEAVENDEGVDLSMHYDLISEVQSEIKDYYE